MKQQTGILKKIADAFRKKISGKNLQKGDLLRLKGSSGAAITAYRHAISINPDEFASHFNLAETLAETEDWQEAVKSYRLALGLEPEFLPALRGLARALFHGDEHGALLGEEFDRADLGPEFFEIYDLLGDAFFKKNEMQDALSCYRKARQLSPESWQACQKLGRVLLRTGEIADAENSFREVIKLSPDYSWAYDGLGDTCRYQYRWEAAAEAYHQASLLDPEYHWHYFKLGEVLMQSGLWEQAANAYDLCHQIDPHLPGLSDRQREVSFNLDQWSQLREYCQVQNNKQGRAEADSTEDEKLSMLLIATQPPYPPTGGAIRLAEEIKFLGSRYRLVVLCFHYSEYESEIRQFLEQYCDCFFLTRPGGRKGGQQEDCPEKVKDLITNDAWNALSDLSKLNFDLVLFHFIYAAGYLELFPNHFTVLQEHNIESEIVRQLLERAQNNNNTLVTNAPEYDVESLQTEMEHLVAYETQLWPQFDLCTTTSESDRNKMKERNHGDVLVVSNGVDTSEVLPVEHEPRGPVLFIGHMSYAPNMDAVNYFVDEILPLLVAQDPSVKFLIAGRKPHESVLRLADNPRVEVIADPAEIQSVANHCSMTVVPLRMGSGTRLKILDSFSMSLPVISTNLGCEGLGLVNEEHLLIRDTPVEFAQAIIELRSNQQLAMKLRINSRRLVKNNFDWSQIFDSFESEVLARVDAREL